MQDRFTLRFQNGEREGESVPISSPRFTVGRRPGNTLQLQDSSVSGQHAELLVTEEGLLLRDLGSTNGTRLGGRKVTEARPAHGDQVSFGSINATLEDSGFLDAPAPAPAAAPSAADAGESVDVVSADLIAKSKKSSKLGLVGLLALLIAGGGAASFFLTGGGGEGRSRIAPVEEVAGNKLPSYSFEGDAGATGWSADEAAPATFDQRGGARNSGEDGLRAILVPGEWARIASEPVAVGVGRSVELAAQLRARGESVGRVGVEFLARDGDPAGEAAANVAWCAWISDVTQFQDVRLVAGVPPGASRARVVIEGRALRQPAATEEAEVEGGGTVDVDDVSLVDGSEAAAPVAKVGECALWLHGEQGTVAQLVKVSQTLLGDLRGTGARTQRDHALTVEPTGGGFRLSAAGAEGLSLRVGADTAGEGVATLGAAGLAEHSGEFEAQEVRVLLLGGGHDLVALAFDAPTRVTARREGAALRVRAAAASATLKVDFREERARAGDLAFAAREAEEQGELGECLARWSELLANAPFEAKLVQEARSARTRLEQAGLVELAEVQASFERARFFRLVDLYRQCKSRAQAVGAKYAGSQVEAQAAALVTEVELALGELEVDLSKDEVDRLRAILTVLEKTESPRLAREVRQYLTEQYGVND